ncbi:hypothetical protein [Paenibacillus sp. J22TS3]|uniref:hypothetical protein n=1 Tax=Paenibacillus sp. J22TS3 TaxID=2807192 RepID=UPI001B044749|nr:hypothetical protein [Paenibacillus sp. J22TS3]GIP24325.1 hypothetical protein J22TS3_46000 [Paenibacillus sp. J22TS3]
MSMELEFEDLLDEAMDLPDSPAKIALLEQAIRVADAAGDIEQGYEARSMLVNTASFNGFPMKALVAFSWQLGQYDKHPELFEYDLHNLLWSYKWILDDLPSFPDIQLGQIHNLLEDFKLRIKKAGHSERTYDYYRFRMALLTGELEKAGEYMDKWRPVDRDSLSNCQACEQDALVEYFFMLGDDERARVEAKKIMSGRMSCAEVPHVTYPKLLMPLYRTGRQDEAAKLERESFRLIKGNRDFIKAAGLQMIYLTHADPFRGLEVYESFAPLTHNHESPMFRMVFDGAAAVLFKRLAREQVKFNVRLPAYITESGAANDVSRLSEIYSELAFDAAGKFDKRNGNRFYTGEVERLLAQVDE